MQRQRTRIPNMNTTTSPADQARTASRKSGKAFCKVCFDAGKEYTSHYLMSAPGPDGKLVCPTLLNQSCLTCGQKGHTSSYCGKRKPMTTTTKPMTTKPMPAKREHYNPKSNAFGALTNDTDTDNKPQTMAERLKLLAQPNVQPPNVQPPNVQPPNVQPPNVQPLNVQPPNKTLPLPLLPPRSQFWWQDEDD